MADSWYITNGTLTSWYGDEVTVQWCSSGCSSGSLVARDVSNIIMGSISVTITASAFTPGYITNLNQTITFNTSPAQINATASTGGECSVNLYYQWQQSLDSINFTDISGANGQNYQPGSLTTSTYFRRHTTCGHMNGYTSNTAFITVTPQLDGGLITSDNSSVHLDSIPENILTTPASGGNCNGAYTYQWQGSVDNIAFWNLAGATSQNYQPPALSNTSYYRRKTSCNQETAFTDTLTISIIQPLDPGCIYTANQVILYDSLPDSLFATPASFGDCNASFQYQWQSSPDNIYFRDMPGETGPTLGFSVPLLQTTWFQRKTICSNEIKYTGSVQITMTDTLIYFNELLQINFTRNNCSSGGSGNIYTYTVAAGTFSSTVDQAAADQMALNHANANGQNDANTFGDCSWYSVEKTGSFTRNNCDSGYAGTTMIYIVPDSSYTSFISQSDADQLAQTDVNINGQNYADSTGTCLLIHTNNNYSGYYFSANCGSQTPIAYYVSVPIGMFTSTISKADANNQAYQYAQTQANTYGTCQSGFTLYGNNSSYGYVYIILTNTSTSEQYYYELYNSGNQIIDNLPAGYYHIEIGNYDWWYMGYDVCGNTTSGYTGNFYNIYLDDQCNTISIYQ